MAHKTCMQLVRESFNAACSQAHAEALHHKWNNATQHMVAWTTGTIVERSIKGMIVALAERCDAYAKGNPDEHGYLGECGYWGECATDYAKALIALLNLDTGRLDCGTCERLIRAIAKNAHIQLEE